VITLAVTHAGRYIGEVETTCPASATLPPP
jgi:hypothetical protein